VVQNRRVPSCGSLNQADRCENGRVRGKTGAELERLTQKWSDFGERSGRALSEGKSLSLKEMLIACRSLITAISQRRCGSRIRDGGFHVDQIKGLTGSTLKIIAVISMLIDHTFYAIFDKVYIGKRLPMPGLYFQDGCLNYEHWIFALERLMRSTIGRIAFPIFCFLLVQGFIHTSSKSKYKLRLLAFALLSEIPFNLAFRDRLALGTSNVFFTLLLGFLSLEMIQKDWHPVFRGLAVAGVALLANTLGCDYGASGVLLIVMLYFAKDDKVMTVLVGLFAILALPAISVMSILAYIPIYFYNGERGLTLKYVFYAFYPVHLLILYFVRCAMVGG
jgi:hypothetical protein